MTTTIDTSVPSDIQQCASKIFDGIRTSANEPPAGDKPSVDSEPLPGKGHIMALASIGATALALAHINGDTKHSQFFLGLAKCFSLSEQEMAKFQNIVAAAELGLLDFYATRQSEASSDNTGNASA